MLALDKNAQDFHFFKAVSGVVHKVKPHETYSSLSRYYGVPARTLWESNGRRSLVCV